MADEATHVIQAQERIETAEEALVERDPGVLRKALGCLEA